MLCLQDQKNQIVKLIAATWHIKDIDELIKSVDIAFDAGVEVGKISQFSVQHSLCQVANKRMVDVIKWDGSRFDEDLGYKFLKQIAFVVEEQHYEVFKGFDFARESRKATRDALHNVILYAKPKGYGDLEGKSYKEIVDIYQDFDDFGYYDGERDRQSKLASVSKASHPGSMPFQERVALHNIVYSDVNQGRRPHTELLSSIYAHGWMCQETNEAELLQAALDANKMPSMIITEHIEQFAKIAEVPLVRRAIDRMKAQREEK